MNEENTSRAAAGSTPYPNPIPQEGTRKPRFIVRIGLLLISHCTFVSALCCFAGALALLLLPALAKNTYISENALMPGSANPMFSAQDLAVANQLVEEVFHWKFNSAEARAEIPRLIARHMEDLDVEVYYHKFHAKRNQFHPLNFFSGTPYSGSAHENSSCNSTCINSIGVIRAPRGDGKEAIVFVTPYNPEKIKLSDALSLGLAYSVFSFLSRVTWLAKDVVWLAADSRYGEYASVAAWLRDYHNPIFTDTLENSRVDMCTSRSVFHGWKKDDQAEARIPEVTRRAGTMAAAIIFKLLDRQEITDKDTLKIYAEASNGQMPNLDLINIVHYLAVHRQGLRVKVESIFSLLNSGWLYFVGNILEWLSGMAANLNPQWRFAIPSQDFVEGAATLVSSMYHQAVGVPTGSHGAFREYQVDAITLEISPMISLNNEAGHSALLLKSGRLIEGVIRSVNNLLEKFHQSFFLYFMTSPGKFVSVGVYMIAFTLLIIPLPILAAALYSKSQRPNFHQELGFATGSWRWLHAAKVVLIVHFWGSMVSLLPYFISKMPETTSTSSMTIWFVLSIFILLITRCVFGSPYPSFNNGVTRSHPQNVDWTLLKAVMTAATAIGLAVMSVINFAAAQMGSLLLVPMCLIVRPLKDVYRAASLKAVFLTSLNIAFVVIGFPPAALFIFKSSLEGFGQASIGDFWDWTESLWAWNSATYLYLLLVHLPCWVLCMHILLHPL